MTWQFPDEAFRLILQLQRRRRYSNWIRWRLLVPLGVMLVSWCLLAVLGGLLERPTREERIRALFVVAETPGRPDSFRSLRRLVELRPGDRIALEKLVRSLKQEGRVADASRLLAATPALSEEERLRRLVALYEGAGYQELAYRSLSDRLTTVHSVVIDREFHELVDRQHPVGPAEWRKASEEGFDRRAIVRLLSYLSGGGRADREEARDLLCRLATQRLDQPDLIFLMDEAEKAGLHFLAFRLGLSVSALADVRERTEVLAKIIRLCLRSSQELPFDGPWESPMRLIESLPGQDPTSAAADRSCRLWGHLELAERLLSHLEDRGIVTADLALETMKTRRRLGLPVKRWLPKTRHGDRCTRVAALELSIGAEAEGDAEVMASRLSEELALLSDAEEAGSPCAISYQDALARAFSWSMRGRRLEMAGRNLLLTELDRHPASESLWEQIAYRLRPWGRDLAPRFARAASRFGSPRFASYAKVAAMAPPRQGDAFDSLRKSGARSRSPWLHSQKRSDRRSRECRPRLPTSRRGRFQGSPAHLLESWFVPGFEETSEGLFLEDRLSSVPWCRYEISTEGFRTVVFPDVSRMDFLRLLRRLAARRFGPIDVDSEGSSMRFKAGGVFTVATVRTRDTLIEVTGAPRLRIDP